MAYNYVDNLQLREEKSNWNETQKQRVSCWIGRPEDRNPSEERVTWSFRWAHLPWGHGGLHPSGGSGAQLLGSAECNDCMQKLGGWGVRRPWVSNKLPLCGCEIAVLAMMVVPQRGTFIKIVLMFWDGLHCQSQLNMCRDIPPKQQVLWYFCNVNN